MTPRTLKVWEDMGVARAAIDAGLWLDGLRSLIAGHPSHDAVTDDSDLPYASLGLPQDATERLLTSHLERYGLRIERGCTLNGISQTPAAVTVQLTRGDGTAETASFAYVVGCDGAHSAVRHALGIAFEGDAFPMTFMLGDVHIAWDLPYGMALRLHQDAPPDLFIAIPLPELGRYRISMIAPDALEPPGGTGHGIQADFPGPSLADLQAVGDDLLPGKPQLSDLRWSSIFRISMRLAARYRDGRIFIAGDAAHIHPPTGGQGMNTGIQDAYNLAWKLALVLAGRATPALLDSYEAERRPVGAEVVARTLAATQNFGRERGGQPDRLADTQLDVTYRGTAWVRDDAGGDDAGPAAGDRAPDAHGLRRHGVGFPFRLFDVLRGTGHVLIASLRTADAPSQAAALAAFAPALRARFALPLRIVAIVPAATGAAERPGIALIEDVDGDFGRVYGELGGSLLVRPDGHIGWRGPSWRSEGLLAYLCQFSPPGCSGTAEGRA